MQIRRAAAADAAAVAEIYAHYVRHTAITFATVAPSAADFAGRIADDRYPFLVAENSGYIVGFVYAAPFRTKEAYRWDVELTIYLAPGCEGCGTGARLMDACLRILRTQGYLNAYSCITLPNERSVGLHRRFGFEELGVFRKTGYKMGNWHDVVWLGRILGEIEDEPAEPKPVSGIEFPITTFMGENDA
ncbi:MAG: N-acetyltransferase [Clostridia bacterium]|nr:N-acetyltransferase [Clostridia bacterium]